MAKIFDGDRMVLIGTFDLKDIEETIQKYSDLGYAEVCVDHDGDIVVYKEESED